MRRPSGLALAVVVTATAAMAAAGCGGDEKPQTILQVASWWNQSPSTADETGYELLVDVSWPDRAFSCFSVPADLHVTVNDKQVPLMIDGNCGGESLVYVTGFQQNVPVTVRLEGGGQVLGQAAYDNLFPGAASVLVTPADGRVKPGDPVVLTLPVQPREDLAFPEFYWMDPPPGVPPYHTSGKGMPSPDGATFQTTAPTTTGRAAVIVKTVLPDMLGGATSCSGFSLCIGGPNNDTIGPVFIDVGP